MPGPLLLHGTGHWTLVQQVLLTTEPLHKVNTSFLKNNLSRVVVGNGNLAGNNFFFLLLLKFFLDLFILYFICVTGLPACACTKCLPGTLRSEEDVGSPKLKL